MLRLPHLLDPYRGLPRTVTIQLLACLIINMGGMAKLFLPLYLNESYHVPLCWVGLLISLYGIGALYGSYRGGSLSDRFDSKMLTRVCMTGAAVCLFLLSLPIPLWLFVPVLVVSGLCDGAFRPINQRLVLEPCPPARRAQAQGMLRVAFNLGVAVSGVTGGFLAGFGYRWVYFSEAVATGIAALWVWYAYRHFSVTLGRRAPPEAASGSDPALGPWRDAAYLKLMAAMVLSTAVFDQMYSTLGLYLRQHDHLAPHWLGYLFSINGLMVVLLQVPVARRIGRWGLGRCTQAGVLCAGASYLLLLAGTRPLWAVLMAVTLTLGELLQSPSCAQLVMKRSEGRLRGRYLGLYGSVWGGRTLYAPALGSWIYGSAGGPVLWLCCAAAALVAAWMQAGPIRAILAGNRPDMKNASR